MATTKRPIDTLGGILDRIQDARDKGKTAGARQCPATHTKVTKRGEASIVFCTHREGHDGDHKGYRRTWSSGENHDTVKV